jgi:tetratricopeptide (TPR) repeat protein
MPTPIRKYDALGFPIPATFDDLPQVDRDGTGKPANSRPNTARSPGASRRKRIVLGLILAGIVVLAAVPWLMNAGQGLLGDWLAQRARQRFNDGDMPGTVADSTRAFTLLGDQLEDERQIELLWIRASAKLAINDLDGSLADFNRVLSSPKTGRAMRVECYHRRSWVHCRQKNYVAAVEDASSAIQLYGRDHEVLLNQRAYIRALANAEVKDKQELEAGLQDVDLALVKSPDNAAFIDTRGYLLHLLGKNEQALPVMERAIDLAGQRRLYHGNLQRWQEDLAVMHFHRGLIYEALGQLDQARIDFLRAEELGYNPDAGVL